MALSFTREAILKRDQIRVLVKKDFKLKYDSTVLGFAWSMLIPLLMSGVYFIVFGLMMRWSSCENYMLYLVSGNFLWHFFASAVTISGTVLLTNATLIKKTAFDRRILVWSVFCTEGAHFVMTLPILVGIMLCFDVSPSVWTLLNSLSAVVIVVFFAMGVAYFYAAVNIMFRDLERVFQIVLMMWLYCSPVFIPIERIPESVLPYYGLNPMTQILQIWRDAFYQPAFHPERLFLVVPIAVLTFVVGRSVFNSIEPRFAEMI